MPSSKGVEIKKTWSYEMQKKKWLVEKVGKFPESLTINEPRKPITYL